MPIPRTTTDFEPTSRATRFTDFRDTGGISSGNNFTPTSGVQQAAASGRLTDRIRRAMARLLRRAG